MPKHGKYTGTSHNQNFQEALDEAIVAAQRADAETGADIITEWRLVTVTGRAGGFVGFREVTVEIETA
jgi:hypothetical protein